MMVFFLNADQRILGRYGGRDGSGPDNRQSLAGLRYAMQAALMTHRQQPEIDTEPREPRFVADFKAARGRNRCTHCHEVKELINNEIEQHDAWRDDLIWRFPPPDNLGFVLEVDRGDVVDRIVPESPAAKAGLKKGDVIQSIAGRAVHSFADASFALDRAPPQGTIGIQWRRQGELQSKRLALPDDWRRSDISWRPSMMHLVPSARLYGRDLKPAERERLGLSATQMAFWQNDPVHKQAGEAGLRPMDIILGFNGKSLDMEAYDFLTYVRRNFVVGDRVIVNLIRDGERMDLPMTLKSF